MTTPIFDSPRSDFSAQHPFERASAEIRACWDLGYHDGKEEIPAAAGEQALIAFILSDRERNIQDATVDLSNDEGELVATVEQIRLLHEDKNHAEQQLLPVFGRHSIGRLAKVFASLYLVIGVVAIVAEFPLSGFTVMESMGTTLTPDQMAGLSLQKYSFTALVAILCLMGFSMKLFYDVLDQKRGRRVWELVLVFATLVVCGISIVGVATLRDAISNQTIAFSHLDRTKGTTDPGELANLQAKAEAAQDEMATRTAFAFKWITIALPMFAAVAIIIGLHQLRNYRKHDRALILHSQATTELTSALQKQARLTHMVEVRKTRLETLQHENPNTKEFLERATAAYRHGVSAGAGFLASQLAQQSLFDRLVVRVRRELLIGRPFRA
jgi:TRAP-type C4-dicarboxylate transport system permease small subunit